MTEPTITAPVGTFVLYRLDQSDVYQITRRRDTAAESGALLHAGNTPLVGQQFPALVVQTWDGGSTVNLQVFLDGTDTHWATSRHAGDEVGQWSPQRPAGAAA